MFLAGLADEEGLAERVDAVATGASDHLPVDERVDRLAVELHRTNDDAPRRQVDARRQRRRRHQHAQHVPTERLWGQFGCFTFFHITPNRRIVRHLTMGHETCPLEFCGKSGVRLPSMFLF